MRRIALFVKLILLVSIAAQLQSCKKGCNDPLSVNYDPEAKAGGECTYPTLSLQFNHELGGEAFEFGKTYQIDGVDVQFSIAQFYVSGVEVGTDNEFDKPEKYLLVKADQSEYELGEITSGHKHMLKFAVGVDSVANHADPATYEADHPLAPKSPTMHWSWNAGYQFIKIEGTVDTDGDGSLDGIIEFHVGTDALLRNVMLMAHQDADTEEVAINLKVDWAKFFDGMDLRVDNITHTGDGPELAKRLADNVEKAFSIE